MNGKLLRLVCAAILSLGATQPVFADLGAVDAEGKLLGLILDHDGGGVRIWNFALKAIVWPDLRTGESKANQIWYSEPDCIGNEHTSSVDIATQGKDRYYVGRGLPVQRLVWSLWGCWTSSVPPCTCTSYSEPYEQLLFDTEELTEAEAGFPVKLPLQYIYKK